MEMIWTLSFIIASDIATSNTALLPVYHDRIVSLKETAQKTGNRSALKFLNSFLTRLQESDQDKDQSTKGSTKLVKAQKVSDDEVIKRIGQNLEDLANARDPARRDGLNNIPPPVTKCKSAF